MKPEPAKEARPPARTLLIEITDQHGGTREVYAPTDDELAELGYFTRLSLKVPLVEELVRLGLASDRSSAGPFVDGLLNRVTRGDADTGANGRANGHPIPDLVTLPAESSIKRDDHADPVRVMGANGRQTDEVLTGEPIAVTAHGEKMCGARGPSLTPLEVLGGVVNAKNAVSGKLFSERVTELYEQRLSEFRASSREAFWEVDSKYREAFTVRAIITALDERLGRG